MGKYNKFRNEKYQRSNKKLSQWITVTRNRYTYCIVVLLYLVDSLNNYMLSFWEFSLTKHASELKFLSVGRLLFLKLLRQVCGVCVLLLKYLHCKCSSWTTLFFSFYFNLFYIFFNLFHFVFIVYHNEWFTLKNANFDVIHFYHFKTFVFYKQN